LTEQEAKSAFNKNMLSTGLLTEGPAAFAEEHDKRWMVSSYEAGDVVFHTPFTVSPLALVAFTAVDDR
jgi:phytanoyl-CoA hydroxylase